MSSVSSVSNRAWLKESCPVRTAAYPRRSPRVTSREVAYCLLLSPVVLTVTWATPGAWDETHGRT